MDITNTNSDAQCDQHQTTGFVDATSGFSSAVSTGTDSTMRQGAADEASFAEFFRRPVLVKQAEWSVGAVAADRTFVFDPWTLWATNARVKSKLDNFYLMKCKLMVKIVVNGTPMQWGKGIMSYHPLSTLDDTVPLVPTISTKGWLGACMAQSQRSHIVFDISQSTGGCLCLPFIWPSNYVRLTSAADIATLGRVHITKLSNFYDPNIVNPVQPSYSVWVWAEEMDLQVPTYTLALQGCLVCKNECDPVCNPVLQGDEYQEGNNGIISGPAGVISALAGRLAKVPYIGPYALATQIGSSAIASIARIFGFSRPISDMNAASVYQNSMGSLATTIGLDNTMKLTFDPKQELTIDPRVVGLDPSVDEMSLNFLTQKESLLTQFVWFDNSPSGTKLGAIAVTPLCGLKNPLAVSANEISYQLTPLAFAAVPFQYWSGTLKYRFEFIASRFMRGRVKIAWDPISTANAGQASNFNVNLNQTIDLAESRNIEFSVSWAAGQPYKKVNYGMSLMNRAVSNYIDGIAAPDIDNAYTNGYISVAVMNRLVSQASIPSDGVTVNVYISAGDDFELHGPNSDLVNGIAYTSLELQGDTDGQDIATLMPNEPVQTISLVSKEMSNVEKKNLVFFGDPIVSIRQLLRRYNLWGIIEDPALNSAVSTTGSSYAINYTEPDFPPYYGYDPNGEYIAFGTLNYLNACRQTLLNFYTPAYLTMRGAIRYKYKLVGLGGVRNDISSIHVQRHTDPNAVNGHNVTVMCTNGHVGVADSITEYTYQNQSIAFEGASSINPEVTKSLNVELPFYSPYRFRLARRLNQRLIPSTVYDKDGSNTFKHLIRTYVTKSNVTSGQESAWKQIAFQKWVSVGEDFALNGFLSVPTMFIYTNQFPNLDGV